MALLAPAGLSGQVVGQESGAATDTSALAVRSDTVPPISPLGALARSMVLPGWGQLAVGRPARGAFYFAAEAASLFMVFKTAAKLKAAQEASPQREGLIEARSRERENWIVLAGFVAFISGVDAWISTHFWDFEPTLGAPADGSLGLAVGFNVSVP